MSEFEGNAASSLSDAIATGQKVREQIALEDVQAFIEAQPDVGGAVVISDILGASSVGASSGILAFTVAYEAAKGPVSRDVVLRYAPSRRRLFYKYDMGRQFRVQRALQSSAVPVPEPLWLDEQGSHLGFPGFIMTRLPGEAPNPSAFARGPIADATPKGRERMLDEATSALIEIHGFDYKAAGLADFAMDARGNSAMEKCVNWYWQTWEWLDLPIYQRLVPLHRWLIDNAASGDEVLTHGDATLHNYMFSRGRLSAVVDWEMSCIGRAEADVAMQSVISELFAAAPGVGITQPPPRSHWIERYEKLGGSPLAGLDYYAKLIAFITLICLESLRRHMAPEESAKQDFLVNRLHEMAEV